MKRTIISISIFCCLFMMGAVTAAQDVPIVPLAPPISPKLINITGTWNYTLSQPTVAGMCPAGTALSGSCSIAGGGGVYTLVYLTGSVCRPTSMCTFSGTLAGNNLSLSNSDIVDNEGGRTTNELKLTVYNKGYATGDGGSRYVHPSGFTCQWSYYVTLTRGK